MSTTPVDFSPRSYQVELMERGLKKNTIIYLPTGSGKTFIALMILKRMSEDLLTRYDKGGKISIILVNTVTLVDQHAKYIRDHTNLKVGRYSGDMNLDMWPRDKWFEEYNKHQVLIMTSQILLNIVTSNYMNLNQVNLLVFDECHRGVNDQPMRQLMKTFNNLTTPPRVIGLTATIINGSCKISKVLAEVVALEVTYHSKIATVEGFSEVVGFATNPIELFKISERNYLTTVESTVRVHLNKVISIINKFQIKSEPNLSIEGYKTLGTDNNSLKKLANLIQTLIYHIESMGTYGGTKAILAFIIQIERLKRQMANGNVLDLLKFIGTTLVFAKQLLLNVMKYYEEKDQVFKYSSDKILKLLEIFKDYKLKSKQDFCGIVFTKQRFTAKIIFFILESLSKCHPDYNFIKPDYMVGFTCDPYKNTRENLFSTKMNRQILKRFEAKEINLIVASNVLEEGVDISKCTLIVKYDKPEDYRSYIQSKGRARHKDSLYYIIVESQCCGKYQKKYKQFQKIENMLNDYVINKSSSMQEPSQALIEKMYNEDDIPPYYAQGPGSAQVNMTNAIPLLCQYCNNLYSDIYTTYTPEWYQKEKNNSNDRSITITILLPTVCPIKELIEGPPMKTVKAAKRAAAMKACAMLHKIGELDDHLLPRKHECPEEDVSFLFTHHPTVKETFTGSSRNKRLHKHQISKYLRGTLGSNTYYLHIIQLEPAFNRPGNTNDSAMYDMYKSSVCFGVLTLNKLPMLSNFPIYVTQGTINVCIKVNQGTVFLNNSDLNCVKKFHCTVFKDILNLIHSFVIFDSNYNTEVLLLVPVDKDTRTINMELLKQSLDLTVVTQLTEDVRSKMEIIPDGFLHKIVRTCYKENVNYLVTNICKDKNSLSNFPSEEYTTYADYFDKKHLQKLTHVDLPLLLVKAIPKKLNFLKPQGLEAKLKRDKIVSNIQEHLPPEMVISQDFPAPLWIQANLLPTILSRLVYMLQIEELRSLIAKEAGLGQPQLVHQQPLNLDKYLLDYKPYIEDILSPVEMPIINGEDLTVIPAELKVDKNYYDKLLEAEYPWKTAEEPKDIERTLDLDESDIDYYEKFMNEPTDIRGYSLRNEIPTKEKIPTFNISHFTHRTIKSLKNNSLKTGPSIADLYRALTAAHANDIVNLERLETLGDSFLKIISSLYVVLRFPKCNEGQYTNLKGKLVSNMNLYYLARRKNFGGIMKYNELSPTDGWIPPTFTVPKEMVKRIDDKELSINEILELKISTEENISGRLNADTKKTIAEFSTAPDDSDEKFYPSLACYLNYRYISDKHIADVVESVLGAYFQSCGFLGGMKFVEWMGIIPAAENIEGLLKQPTQNPVLATNTKTSNISCHLPQWKNIETIIGYHFKNPAYLLQAFTHSSYTLNRITLSYETLEFLGDAILDFLITCYIFESCGNLNPGELTDLRSSLVNNNTFASFLVRHGLHKFLLLTNMKLQRCIDRFADFLAAKNYQIDDDVLILLDEDDLLLAEYVDIPKVLGDVFESIAGAIYLDSGKDLNVVWEVFYKFMWREIEMFSKNVPKNVVRKLFETPRIEPKYGNAVYTQNNRCIMPLRFLLNEKPKLVHGCGSNKVLAKRAAAKLALRTLEK